MHTLVSRAQLPGPHPLELREATFSREAGEGHSSSTEPRMTEPFTPLADAPKAIITAIEITRHRQHFDPPFHASWDTKPRTFWDAAIVRVHTDLGVTGVGSGDMMLGFEGHEHLFIGQDAMAIERHWRILNNISFHWGRCWPLDLALWDLAGKITGQPCWKLLGGLSNRVRAYASSGTLRGPADSPTRRRPISRSGFTAMKIRFHRGDWRDDIKALEAVRARVGDRLDLMVDCNQGWRMSWDAYAPWSLKDALKVARELERLGVYWMEEPLHRGDRDGMRRLREHDRRAHRRRRDDARTLRVPRSDHRGLPRRAAARRRAGRRHHRACAASR